MSSLNPKRFFNTTLESLVPGLNLSLGEPNIAQALAAGEGTVAGLTPEIPTVEAADTSLLLKPKTMPTPDDEAMRLARRRSIASQMQRRGRASTILTADDVLGG